MSIKIGNEEFTEFNDLYNDSDFLSDSERAEIEFEVALIGKLIEAREQCGMSQKQLADLTGLKQPAIARLENLKAIPKIDTLFKLLDPLGYTLAIVPKEKTIVK
ncbi:helix-turn-helix domain-containing protein [Acetobacterium wieringae]|uniref:helix-turn-helix domain-containing protein n=1 Tax=Acetobacterium wieringae TaxID=52694 RepID=UPI0020340A76|nr:helix-turn-helix transcriptional regulator [Acetobacterium wieringae]URN83747.1 helix-turn-helix transcriptional regulator [Acetobacterium wieringae]